MRKYTVLKLCAVAIALGIASPFLVNLGPADAAASDGLFHAWFYAMPTVVDLWLWPDGPIPMLLLAMVVFTVQYLALFAAVAGLLQFAKVAQDFISPYKHRRLAGSLMRRRA
ncbi:MAG: hypothetical protein HY854_15200 [Burkholderiales bacterium]|nr:hypothetical protein [Burkholderiales bacterium]